MGNEVYEAIRVINGVCEGIKDGLRAVWVGNEVCEAIKGG